MSSTAQSLPIEISSLCKAYGPIKALDDVSLNIAAGEFLTLLGPSGSGKSTVANKVAEQFRKITGGLVIVFSLDTDEDSSFPCADVRLSVEKAAELTLEDVMGELDEETGERQRTMVAFDDHLSGCDKFVTAAVLQLQRAVIEREVGNLA